MVEIKYFVVKRRLKDGFTLPLAMYDTYDAAKRFIEAEVKEKTIEPGFEEYVEKRVMTRRKGMEL